VGCSLQVHVSAGKVAFISPDPKGSSNLGHSCVKGRFAHQFVHSKERLTSPLIKENGVFKKVGWEEALKLVADRFKATRKKYGPEAFAAISSSRCSNEENYLMQKFTRSVMGTNSVDNCSRVCHSPSAFGLNKSLGTGAGTNSFEDLDVTDCIFLIGANPTEAHPVAGARLKQAVLRGAKLIVADPRNIELARYANVHLALKPGSNVALVNALGHVLLEEKLFDKDFIEAHTEGFREIRTFLKDYSPEKIAEITGLNPEDIRRAAHIYGKSPRAMICWGLGVTEAGHGSNTVFALINMALMTGNFGRPGTGANPFRGQNNVQGASDVGTLPNVFSDYRSVTDPVARREHETVWGVSLPEQPGYTIPEMMDAAVAGKLKAMWIVAEDVAQSDPNTEHILSALENLEFLVVQDIFMCETAHYADVVLPGGSYLEKEGTFVNSDRRIQRVRRAIAPLEGTRPDADIIVQVAEKMGHDMGFGSHPDAAKVMDELAFLSPNWRGVNYQRLEEKGFLQWPCKNLDDPGSSIVHRDGKFISGKGKFMTTPWQRPGELPDEDYPFFLTTGRQLFHYNVGTMTRRTDVAKLTAGKKETLRLHPKDAKKLDIKTGDQVAVISRRGQVQVAAEVTRATNPGTFYMTFHFPETRTNILVGAATDEFTGCPEYKVVAVQVKKL
jgi:formate dehydrogenase alpha subunit